MNLTTVIGLAAAVCTTASYVPQLRKCWETGSAGDLSLKMFLVLATGISLWIAYGTLQRDVVIIRANTVSLCLRAGIVYFKLRNVHGACRTPESDGKAGHIEAAAREKFTM